MEPGFRDREYQRHRGNTIFATVAAMEPGFRDREYLLGVLLHFQLVTAAMEPGFRDREYCVHVGGCGPSRALQWSPVLETGNTPRSSAPVLCAAVAAMEPGFRDREY